MLTAKWNRLAAALIVTGQGCVGAPASTAGQISDFLFGKPIRTTEPVVASYPPGVVSPMSSPIGACREPDIDGSDDHALWIGRSLLRAVRCLPAAGGLLSADGGL